MSSSTKLISPISPSPSSSSPAPPSSSSSSSSSSSVRSSRRLLTPQTPTIPLLLPSAARIYNHAHAPLVLAYYVLTFRRRVADQSLHTMAWDLVPVAVAQCAFCAVCLPSAGTWGAHGGRAIIEGTARSGGGGGGRRKLAARAAAGGGAGSWKSKVMPLILSLLLTLLLAPLPLTLLALVLGAPLSPASLIPPTLLLSVHVSFLAVLPLFYTHGVSGPAWRDVLAAWLPFDEAGVWGGSVGCVVGAWVGAVPMALDWDRDWQAWPVPVLTGAYLGWGLGRVLTADLKLGVGRRIDLSVDVYGYDGGQAAAEEEEGENESKRGTEREGSKKKQ